MRTWKMHLLAAALSVVLLPPCVDAQEGAGGDKFTNVTWYQVLYHKFKPGRTAEGSQIIYQHFLPVDKAVGRKVIPFDHHTGEWDHLAYFPLDEGPGELEWRPFSRPIDKKWWDALVKQEGGPDNAGAVLRKFGDTLADTKWEIARRVSLPWCP